MNEQQFDELLATDVYMAYQNATAAAAAAGLAGEFRVRLKKLLATASPIAQWLRRVLPVDASV